MSITCPHCGATNPDDANFCSRCGTDLRTESAQRPPSSSESGADRSIAPEQAEQIPPEQGRGAGEQPWLRPDFLGDDDIPFEAEDLALGEAVDDGVSDATDIPVVAGRLVSGVQGLLEPIRVATMPGETAGEPSVVLPAAPDAALSIERLRRVRALMGEEPLLASARGQTLRSRAALWVPWIFLVMALAVAAPFLGIGMRNTGTARAWPGVGSAFAAINHLSAASAVQILWAYDPATAGEMDVVAAPVMRHLLDKGVRPTIYSLLPAGPATARRLISAVQDQELQRGGGLGQAALEDVQFLPGGVMVLPAIAQEPATLALVFGAQPEDVQAWLEQVAPRNGAPVVAITAAGADPTLRPYLDSGQLVGLVSGFDGAATYTALLDQRDPTAQDEGMKLQLAGQNLAILAIIGLIVIGNFAALFGGRRNDG